MIAMLTFVEKKRIILKHTYVYKQKLEARRAKKKLLQEPQQRNAALIRQQMRKDFGEKMRNTYELYAENMTRVRELERYQEEKEHIWKNICLRKTRNAKLYPISSTHNNIPSK